MKIIISLESLICNQYELVHNTHGANMSLHHYFYKLNSQDTMYHAGTQSSFTSRRAPTCMCQEFQWLIHSQSEFCAFLCSPSPRRQDSAAPEAQALVPYPDPAICRGLLLQSVALRALWPQLLA